MKRNSALILSISMALCLLPAIAGGAISAEPLLISQNPDPLHELNKKIEANPSDADAYLERGKVFLGKNQAREAVLDFNKAIGLKPQSSDAYFQRGLAYYRERMGQEALHDFTYAYTLNTKNLDALRAKADTCNYMLKNYPEAIAGYNKYLQLDPRSAVAYQARADAYAAAGKPALALADYGNAIKVNPREASGYTQRGNLYMENKQYAEAMTDFGYAIRVNPKAWDPYYKRAQCYINQERYQFAIADLNAAISLNPNQLFLYSMRGTCDWQTRQFDKGAADFAKAASLDTGNPHSELWRNAGDCLMMIEKYNDAIADFTKVLEGNPKNAAALTARANAYEKTGRMDECYRDRSLIPK